MPATISAMRSWSKLAVLGVALLVSGCGGDGEPTVTPAVAVSTTTHTLVSTTTTLPPSTTVPLTTIATVATAISTTGDARRPVPSGLVGADPNTARGTLQDAGFLAAETGDPGCTGLNTVTSTSPASGTLASIGSTVTLYICY